VAIIEHEKAQLFKVLFIGLSAHPQPWLQLINGLVNNALLKLSIDKDLYEHYHCE